MSTSQAVPSTSEPYFDTTSQKWMVETQQGTELEWDQHRNQWVPLVSSSHSANPALSRAKVGKV